MFSKHVHVLMDAHTHARVHTHTQMFARDECIYYLDHGEGNLNVCMCPNSPNYRLFPFKFFVYQTCPSKSGSGWVHNLLLSDPEFLS